VEVVFGVEVDVTEEVGAGFVDVGVFWVVSLQLARARDERTISPMMIEVFIKNR
jgi:hypothetical protein